MSEGKVQTKGTETQSAHKNVGERLEAGLKKCKEKRGQVRGRIGWWENHAFSSVSNTHRALDTTRQ